MWLINVTDLMKYELLKKREFIYCELYFYDEIFTPKLHADDEMPPF